MLACTERAEAKEAPRSAGRAHAKRHLRLVALHELGQAGDASHNLRRVGAIDLGLELSEQNPDLQTAATSVGEMAMA